MNNAKINIIREYFYSILSIFRNRGKALKTLIHDVTTFLQPSSCGAKHNFKEVSQVIPVVAQLQN